MHIWNHVWIYVQLYTHYLFNSNNRELIFSKLFITAGKVAQYLHWISTPAQLRNEHFQHIWIFRKYLQQLKYISWMYKNSIRWKNKFNFQETIRMCSTVIHINCLLSLVLSFVERELYTANSMLLGKYRNKKHPAPFHFLFLKSVFVSHHFTVGRDAQSSMKKKTMFIMFNAFFS